MSLWHLYKHGCNGACGSFLQFERSNNRSEPLIVISILKSPWRSNLRFFRNFFLFYRIGQRFINPTIFGVSIYCIFDLSDKIEKNFEKILNLVSKEISIWRSHPTVRIDRLNWFMVIYVAQLHLLHLHKIDTFCCWLMILADLCCKPNFTFFRIFFLFYRIGQICIK